MTDAGGIAELSFLVVEDQGFQRWAMCNVLHELGARRVVSAGDGRDALALCRDPANPIDIVVSDLDMPGMDGMEFIRHLGEAGANASLILASGLERSLIASVEMMARAYGVRLLGAIEKPATARKLQPLIDLHRAQPGGARRLLAPAKAFTVEEILAALQGGQFAPFFQAKVDMRSGAVKGAEALARWHHPTEGVVGPAAFIPNLERSGDIAAFTTMMVKSAAASCRAWRGCGYDASLALNLSQESLADLGLADLMVQLVRSEGLDPHDVIFEVTESAMALDLGRALENLSRLRLRGFGLSIDDYGTGYSSMQQLTRIAFTELKIDKTFVRNAAGQQPNRVMLESSLEMAEKLGIDAVAEGVELKSEWDLLLDLGCDMAQGYLVSRPMAAGDFLRWLKRRSAAAQAH